MWLGHGADDQTFVGGLRVYELSCWPQLWTVGLTQTGGPPCQTGNKPTPAGHTCALHWAKSVRDYFENAVLMGERKRATGTHGTKQTL